MDMPQDYRRRNGHSADPVGNHVARVAARLLDTVDPEQRADQALRHLLERALTAAAEAQARISEQRREIEQLRTLSVTDEATGLLNRRGFSEAMNRAVERGQRYGETGALLVIDLDGFKTVNDTYGHAAGDYVLASVARVLKQCVRKLDDVARIGGDEFAVLLNQTTPEHAAERANLIELYLNGLVAPWRGKNIHVRASVGSQCFGAETNPEDVFTRADVNMYMQKSGKTPNILPA
ncbi:MAG: GGDEF domain-containing protein [Alphaproteobacteria bacterium]